MKQKIYLYFANIFWFLILMLIVSLFYSCKSYVPISEVTHDTLTIVKRDTLSIFMKQIQRDTIKERHDTTIILREDGTILERNITNNYYHSSVSNDSTSFYKALCDSLSRIREQEEIKQEKDPWMIFSGFKDFIVGAFIVFLMIIILKYKK